MTAPTFTVDLWGSHPFAGNDDCWTGLDFDSLEEALECYHNLEKHFEAYALEETRFVKLDGPNVDAVYIKEVFGYVTPESDSDDAWERERAMQAGMAFGCDGYNDFYGY